MNKLVQKAWVLALGLCLYAQSAQSTPVFVNNSCAYESQQEAHICSNDSFFFNQQWIKAEGIYTATFSDANGCDSTVHLTLWHMPNSYGERIMHLCEGSVLNLGGHTISSAGTYKLSYKASWGCDSIVLVHVKALASIQNTVKKVLCEGDSIFFGTRWIQAAGSYTSNYARNGACDSIVTLQVEVIKTRTPILKESDGLYAAIPADAYQWLACPSYFPIPHGTSSKLTIVSEGNYALRIENRGCIDTLDCTYFNRKTTGLEDEANSNITLYPNPASETFSIRGSFTNTVHIQIINMLGQNVLQHTMEAKSVLQVDIRELLSGKYIVRVMEEGGDSYQSILLVD